MRDIVGARLFEQLRPSSIGTESVVKDHEYFDYDLTLKPTARRFEDGSPNLPGILGLGAALNLLVRAGLARVEAHVLHLAQLLRDELPRRGYQLVAPGVKPAEHSGIVSFRHPRTVPDEVEARLRDATGRSPGRGAYHVISITNSLREPRLLKCRCKSAPSCADRRKRHSTCRRRFGW